MASGCVTKPLFEPLEELPAKSRMPDDGAVCCGGCTIWIGMVSPLLWPKVCMSNESIACIGLFRSW